MRAQLIAATHCSGTQSEQYEEENLVFQRKVELHRDLATLGFVLLDLLLYSVSVFFGLIRQWRSDQSYRVACLHRARFIFDGTDIRKLAISCIRTDGGDRRNCIDSDWIIDDRRQFVGWHRVLPIHGQ